MSENIQFPRAKGFIVKKQYVSVYGVFLKPKSPSQTKFHLIPILWSKMPAVKGRIASKQAEMAHAGHFLAALSPAPALNASGGAF